MYEDPAGRSVVKCLIIWAVFEAMRNKTISFLNVGAVLSLNNSKIRYSISAHTPPKDDSTRVVYT